MDQNGINKNQLSIQTNIGSAHIYSYCDGPSVPNVETLIKLADYFNCTTDYLFGLSENNNNQNLKSNISFNLKDFNKRFESALGEKSKYEISAMAELDTSIIYNWKHSNRKPSIKTLLKLGEVIPVSIDYLLGRKDVK